MVSHLGNFPYNRFSSRKKRVWFFCETARVCNVVLLASWSMWAADRRLSSSKHRSDCFIFSRIITFPLLHRRSSTLYDLDNLSTYMHSLVKHFVVLWQKGLASCRKPSWSDMPPSFRPSRDTCHITRGSSQSIVYYSNRKIPRGSRSSIFHPIVTLQTGLTIYKKLA